MQILRYVQSEEFGKYGESIKLIENINVSASGSSGVYVILRTFRVGIHDQVGVRKCQARRGECYYAGEE